MAQATESEKTTRRKAYAPTDADYDLCCINLEDAENGVSVKCEYRLKDDAKAKVKSSKGESYVPYDLERKSLTNVFTEKAEAKTFIMEELDKMWVDPASGGEPDEDDE